MDDELARFQAEMSALDAKKEEQPAKRHKTETHSAPKPSPNIISAEPQLLPSVLASQFYARKNLSSAALPAALSGFGPGMITMVEPTPRTNFSYQAPILRMDMETGEPLPVSEASNIAKQQSIYGYNPNQTHIATTVLPASENVGKGKGHKRMAGGSNWTDHSLSDWPDNDFRLFCGDLGNEVTVHFISRRMLI